MTCCSLRHRGVELIGERYGLAAYASCGTTMGMSVMHPWADRLSSWGYTACGATVRLPVSPLLHTDRWGLPVNGVQACGHAWVLEDSGAAGESAWLDATLPFDMDPRRLELFPFPHRLHLHAEVTGGALCISTEIEATGSVPVPACFGYRLYLRREQLDGDGTLVLPPRQRLVTDERLLPTGVTESHEMSAHTLGVDELHEVFVLGEDRCLTVAAGARRLTVEPLAGFPLAQVRTVASEPHVMLEALTATPDALSHDLFAAATPGRPYRAALRLSVDDLCTDRSRLSSAPAF
jgi:galactose mutarotase-like enzyme